MCLSFFEHLPEYGHVIGRNKQHVYDVYNILSYTYVLLLGFI